jgi:hypothetical protein
MSTETFVELIVLALCQEMTIHVTEHRPEAVGILQLFMTVEPRHFEPVRKSLRARQRSHEHTLVVEELATSYGLSSSLIDDFDFASTRQKRAHDEMVTLAMHAQIGERIVVVAVD